jgi:hypothetical protein
MITIRTGMTIGGTSQEPILSTFLMPGGSRNSEDQMDNQLRAPSCSSTIRCHPKSDALMSIKGLSLIKDAAKRPT